MARTNVERALSTDYLARKGDLLAIERRHSSTRVHGATIRNSEWVIGKAKSVARDGFVKSAVDMNGHEFTEYDQTHNLCVFYKIASADQRAAAAKLGTATFATKEELRAAIIA